MHFRIAFGRKATKYSLLISLFLLGCSNLTKEVDIEDLSAEEIYAKAEQQFESGDNIKAAELFLEVERIYPYSS
jgi:outer membrane protein assembly factor BamD